MPRPLRFEIENGWYHVMNRGAGNKNIYFNSNHKQMFLDIIAETSKLFDIQVHAYCLMDNHYHLLIKTPHANLSRAMRHINGVYTQKFNRDMNVDGALFRGRYKAIIIETDSYSLLQVNRYIHLNPASIDYPWSSYLGYLRMEKRQPWLHTDEILSLISQEDNKKKFEQFIQAGLDYETQCFYGQKKTPVIFGSRSFKHQILKAIKREKIKQECAFCSRLKSSENMSKIGVN